MNDFLKQTIDSYDEKELEKIVMDATIKKHYGKKRYVDFGIGCYYEAYIHSYGQTKFGSFFFFVKNKEEIDKSFDELSGYLSCNLNNVYDEKQPFMKTLCNY